MNERLSLGDSQGITEILPQGSRIVIFCDGIDSNQQASQKEGEKSLINGVKTTVKNITRELENSGYEPSLIYPGMFRSLPVPTYPELRVPVIKPKKIRALLRESKPDAVLNMSSEGGLGYLATRACKKFSPGELVDSEKIIYTAAYTTNLDHYISAYLHDVSSGKISLSPDRLDRVTRRIYNKSQTVLVPTERIQEKLKTIGIEHTVVWPPGVDSNLFRPLKNDEKNAFSQYLWENNIPVLLSYGRISREKNYDDFLSLPTPGFHKVIIGDGPLLKTLKEKYENDYTHFLGKMHGEELAHHIRSARLMIFPSKADTFGLVATEAAASGVPVVAYDVQGPGDTISQGINGILVPEERSLLEGIPKALHIDRQRCANYASQKYSWPKATEILLANLHQIQWVNPYPKSPRT